MSKQFILIAAGLAVAAVVGGVPSVQAASSTLAGKILLQVQSRGEAWYVSPTDGKRTYLRDGESAYRLMRTMGLGVTDADLAKIPVGFSASIHSVGTDTDKDGLIDPFEQALGTDHVAADTDGDGYIDGVEIQNAFNPLGAGAMMKNTAMVNRLRGRLLLQTEGRGEVWYLNPADGKRYYLRDGYAAYDIMRSFGLGITNANLAKVAVSDVVLEPAMVDCGIDTDCFIRAAETCAPSTVRFSESVALGAIVSGATSLFEVRGVRSGACEFYSRVERVQTSYDDSVGAEDRARFDDLNRRTEGREATCQTTSAHITSMLRRWQDGSYSSADYDDMSCTGTLFDPLG